MLDELLQYLNKEGIQYLISWIKERLNLKFDKKHMVSLTAAEFQALIDSDSVDPDTYYSIIDDSQSETRYAHYVLFPVADWVEEDGMWSQTVSIAGMTDDQTLFLIPYKQDLITEAESKAYDKDYGLFVSGKGQTLNGAVNYKLWTKPSADITIGLMITDTLSTGGGGGKGGSGVVVSDTEPEDPTVELWVDTSPKGNVDLVTRDEIADLLENGVCCDDLEAGDPILAPVEVLMKTDALTLEEIQASSPEMLEGKVAGAGAMKELDSAFNNTIMRAEKIGDNDQIRTIRIGWYDGTYCLVVETPNRILYFKPV